MSIAAAILMASGGGLFCWGLVMPGIVPWIFVCMVGGGLFGLGLAEALS